MSTAHSKDAARNRGLIPLRDMPADASAELIFGLRQVETPLENARKASTYDSMLDSFLIGRDGMVEVYV